VIYLDTSALTKLLIAEAETPGLRAWLTTQTDDGEHAVTSALSRVELMRVVAPYGEPGQAERARYLVGGLDILPLTESVIALAEKIGPASSRSRRDPSRGGPNRVATQRVRHVRPPLVGQLPRRWSPNRIRPPRQA